MNVTGLCDADVRELAKGASGRQRENPPAGPDRCYDSRGFLLLPALAVLGACGRQLDERRRNGTTGEPAGPRNLLQPCLASRHDDRAPQSPPTTQPQDTAPSPNLAEAPRPGAQGYAHHKRAIWKYGGGRTRINEARHSVIGDPEQLEPLVGAWCGRAPGLS